MKVQERRDAIFGQAWQACDIFRGAIDPDRSKYYILPLLFVKYLSDIHKSKRAAFEAKYNGDPIRVARALSLERFVIPQIELRGKDDRIEEVFPATYESLYKRRTRPNIGQLINILLAHIEDANQRKLHHVFRNIDFNSEALLGPVRRRNARLKNLLEALNGLDLRPETIGQMENIGDVYECLLEKFAAAGKKGGEGYTPPAVSETLARLVAPRPGDRICDPACGSGSLLIRTGKQVSPHDYTLYGQELDGSTWALCKLNMYLHGLDAARIEWGDSLRRPQFVNAEGFLLEFDVVVANPPFSLDQWGQEIAAEDPYNRFHRGIPPRSKGDWAFIAHMLATAVEGSGRVGVVVPHGVLFRGGQESAIREAVIRENILDAVIGLPANLFFGTGMPAALMLFDKSRPTGGAGDVLFIDASREFEPGTNQNRLRPQDIEKIVATCRKRQNVAKYAYRATRKEIEAHAFNLNLPLYVDTFEPEPRIDIQAFQDEIAALEKELAQTQTEMRDRLRQLGVGYKPGEPRRLG